jgi:hypothetical protein
MGIARWQFTDEFKREAVGLLASSELLKDNPDWATDAISREGHSATSQDLAIRLRALS